jgi:hypothetical protein
MAVKTFTTGEVLTAADTNTYLNNGGLVYIKSQTVGTAVSSVTVSSAFSADYDNYKIMCSGGTTSTATVVYLALGSSTTGYYMGLNGADSAGVSSPIAISNGTYWNYNGVADTTGHVFDTDLYQPYLAAYTFGRFTWADPRTNNAWRTGSGVHRVATSYTAFTVGVTAGTMTGGTITVYGYRKA